MYRHIAVVIKSPPTILVRTHKAFSASSLDPLDLLTTPLIGRIYYIAITRYCRGRITPFHQETTHQLYRHLYRIGPGLTYPPITDHLTIDLQLDIQDRMKLGRYFTPRSD